MAFCSKCGASVADGTAFCANCGNPMNAAPQTPPAPAYNPYSAPVAPVAVKAKTPGRGFGISSLVLSIIGLIYSLYMTAAASLYGAATDMASSIIGSAANAYDDEVMGTILLYSVLSILAVCFAAGAFKKGYKNGVSKAGLVMGIIGLCFFVVALANCA